MVVERGLDMSRSASASVKRYLELLARQPRRGTSAADQAPIRRQLEAVEENLTLTADPLARVQMHQQIIDLQATLSRVAREQGDFEQIEEEFVQNVAAWAQSKGVTYDALRTAGVAVQVLRRAGMS